ncbi:MAG TPA: ABC transporter substrate-binding protein, partial [Desulfobulbaceae bacterium]|nr:ABC transporter substrate-binding protein [Desulfobulbaceae bacterium]
MKLASKLLVAVLLVVFTAMPALAEKTIKWKLAMTWPSTLTPLASPPIKLAEMV